MENILYMLNKRGISPLIATVLIIGFTIALAAVIISWGQTFTRQIQQETETSSNEQIACATEVVFDVTNGCQIVAGNQVKVIVKNDGSRIIDSFLIRSYQAADNVAQNSLSFATNGNGIPAFGIESETYSPSYTLVGSTKMVELIPVVTIEGKQVTCSLNIKRYGQVDGPGLLDC